MRLSTLNVDSKTCGSRDGRPIVSGEPFQPPKRYLTPQLTDSLLAAISVGKAEK